MATPKTLPMRTWLDRMIGVLSPAAELRRMRARVATALLARHYEAASSGRRTQHWRKPATDANAAVHAGLGRLRNLARDLVRNNPHAESAIDTIENHTVGTGIVPRPFPANAAAAAAWKEWAGSTACDADGRLDFAGLQGLTIRTVVESGEALVRLRPRRLEDGLPLPLQLQVLEPDYLDTSKTAQLPSGGRVINGVELDRLGRRVAYWLFPEHPGSEIYGGAPASRRVPAERVLHVFKPTRAGQVRAASWFAPVLLRFKDFDEYEDATLVKQKIAACLAVLTTDPDGQSPPLGEQGSNEEEDMLEPGLILNLPPGRNVEVVQPPQVGDYKDYSEVSLRAIAAGLGVAYEDLTGSYQRLPFSAARMSRIRHWSRVVKWRRRMLIPQLCTPVWVEAMRTAAIIGRVSEPAPLPVWSAPPPPMIEPDKEGLAYQRNIRGGIMSLSEAIRERGYDPEELLRELADDFELLDTLGLILDCDPRRTTQAGNPRQQGAGAMDPDEPSPAPTDAEETTDDELTGEEE